MDGLQLLASMRLCSNALAQAAIPVALQNFEQIRNAVRPGGRLFEQKNMVVERLNSMQGLSCAVPGGAMYVFPSVDKKVFRFINDQDFVLQLLVKKNVLLVPGKVLITMMIIISDWYFLPHFSTGRSTRQNTGIAA